MPHDFGDSARALLQERKKLQDQGIVTPEVWVRDLHIEPSTPYFRTNNFIQNTLARLVGWYPRREDWRRLLCDAQGRLEVSTIQASYDNLDTQSGTAPDAYGAFTPFDDVAKRVDIFIWDYNVFMKISADGITERDGIEVPANLMYSLDATCKAFKIKNTVAGQAARYHVNGWW